MLQMPELKNQVQSPIQTHTQLKRLPTARATGRSSTFTDVVDVVADVVDVIASINNDKAKQLLVLHTRPITKEHLTLFNRYSQKILQWSDLFINMPLSTLEYDYIFMDMQNLNCLKQIHKEDLRNFNVCAFIDFYEISNFDDCENVQNVFSKFPDATATKEEFDNELMREHEVVRPAKCLSFVSFFFNAWTKLQKK
jgi:hypothetical protein